MNLEYDVKYSDRKTFGLSVERDKSVVVRVPHKTTEKQIDNFINKKKFWIFTKLKHPQKNGKTRKTEFVSGASIMYLGRNYKLDIVNEELAGIEFNGKFKLSSYKRKQAFDLFKDWYISKAKEKIVPKVRFFADNLGVKYNEIKISDIKYRWGSCTPKNNLNFNWRLVKSPFPVIEYVIVHELAHLIEPNHTPRFWNIVKVQLPQYKQTKEWLKDNGHVLAVDI